MSETEMARQGRLRDMLMEAYQSNVPVTVRLRDGEKRAGGGVMEIRDMFSHPTAVGSDGLTTTYEIRVHGSDEMIRGLRIMDVEIGP